MCRPAATDEASPRKATNVGPSTGMETPKTATHRQGCSPGNPSTPLANFPPPEPARNLKACPPRPALLRCRPYQPSAQVRAAARNPGRPRPAPLVRTDLKPPPPPLQRAPPDLVGEDESAPAAAATPQVPTPPLPGRHDALPKPPGRCAAAPLAPAQGQRFPTSGWPAPAEVLARKGRKAPPQPWPAGLCPAAPLGGCGGRAPREEVRGGGG
nr:WAS/WASL-interacting protein family member 2-like [Aegilops tauschii subsp. strangulata]